MTKNAALALLLISGAGCISHEGAKRRTDADHVIHGEWPSPAYDRGRTGRTPAAGNIRAPALAWQLDMTAREYFAVVTPHPGRGETCRLDKSIPLDPPDGGYAAGLGIDGKAEIVACGVDGKLYGVSNSP